MQCRYCSKESRTTDFCEWCRLPLLATAQQQVGGAVYPTQAGSQPTVQLPQPDYSNTPVLPGSQPISQPGIQPHSPYGSIPTAPTQTRRRVSLSGEVIEDSVQTLPTQQMTANTFAQPPIGALQQPGVGRATAAPLPPGAYSAMAMQASFETVEPDFGERWEKCMAISLPIIALSMLLIHFVPGSLLFVLFGNLFVLSIVMGATNLIPHYEEAIFDCAIMLTITVLFGPLIALVLYLITCAIKQEVNHAVTALLSINIIIPKLFGVVFANSADTIGLVSLWSLFGLTSIVGVFLSFFGWLISSFFRPVGD